jgi:hypothetical protein
MTHVDKEQVIKCLEDAISAISRDDVFVFNLSVKAEEWSKPDYKTGFMKSGLTGLVALNLEYYDSEVERG